jgi:hypothetical protein
MDREPGDVEHLIKIVEPLLGLKITAKGIWFDSLKLWVELSDERIIGVPLTRFPRLMKASDEDRNSYELSVRGIHWDKLDEDISVGGLLYGCGDVTRGADSGV